MEDITAKQILVQGKVQGVYFRKFTQEKAQLLELSGWVRNKDDGRVEIHAEGPSDQVQELADWCCSGSPMAVVSNVEVSDAVIENLKEFIIRR